MSNKKDNEAFLVKNKAISKSRRLDLLDSGYRLIGNVWFNPDHWALDEEGLPDFTFFHVDEYKTGLTIKFEGIKFNAKTNKANDFVKNHRNEQRMRFDGLKSTTPTKISSLHDIFGPKKF